jgi:hypothetical protein
VTATVWRARGGMPGDPAEETSAAAWRPGPGAGDEQMSLEKARQLASMLPQLIPTVLGAAGGLVDGVLQMVGKAPEMVMQAGSQQAAQVSQSLGGLMKQGM